MLKLTFSRCKYSTSKSQAMRRMSDIQADSLEDAVRAFQVDNAGGLRKRDDDLSILLTVMDNKALSNPSSVAGQ